MRPLSIQGVLLAALTALTLNASAQHTSTGFETPAPILSETQTSGNGNTVIPGCTDQEACNYSAQYTSDDGSCCYASLNTYIPTLIPNELVTTITFDIEVSGAVPDLVSSADDIAFVYLNVEHSFLGDLYIELTCPNGESIVLHAQGGGSTNLGEPVVGDTTPEIYGVGYNYFWSPTATLGTMADEADFTTLPEGTYSSVDNFQNLVGCPTNGTWELSIVDLLASDNGYVFDVGMGFGEDVADLNCSFCALGCTDPTACNYNLSATEDDGSCILPDGCTDPEACNFNPSALCDDGTCVVIAALTIAGTTTPQPGENQVYAIAPNIVEGLFGWQLVPQEIGTLSTPNAPSTEIQFSETYTGPGQVCLSYLFDADCQTEICLELEVAVGVAETERLLESVHIYPNPVTDHMRLEVPEQLGPVTLTLRDLTGRLLLERSVQGLQTIDMTNYSQGVYLLQLQKGSLQQVMEVIKH